MSLDARILAFIRKYSRTAAPEPVFGSLALELFEHQYVRNEFYQKFCRLEGVRPGRLTRWQDIPAMPAAGFKELALTCFPLKKAVKVFKTSGTTSAISASADTPLRGVHFFDTLKLYEAALLPPFQKFLIPDGTDFSFHYLVQSPRQAPHSSLSYMIGVIDRRLARGRGRYYIKEGGVDSPGLARGLKGSRKRVCLLATAFSLKVFLDHLKEKDLALVLPKGSRLMETGGFKGRVKAVSRRALYAECQKRLGIPKAFCFSEYGMTELSSQFYSREGGPMLGPSWIRTLIVDTRTGRPVKKGRAGLLRHFDLANRGSVMAVQTEDLGRQTGGGFELLGRASDAELRGCSLTYEEFLRA